MLPIILAIRDENDRTYVEGVYIKYYKRIYYVANSHLDHHQDSEDCVQDVVIALIDHLEEFMTWSEKHQCNFLAKCCRCIAINKYNEREKQRKMEVSVYENEKSSEMEIIDEDSIVDRMIVSQENQKRLCQLIEDLDPKYGDLLFFRGFMNMKNIEIAKMLDISVNLVNIRILRARQILLQKWGEEINEIFRN